MGRGVLKIFLNFVLNLDRIKTFMQYKELKLLSLNFYGKK